MTPSRGAAEEGLIAGCAAPSWSRSTLLHPVRAAMVVEYAASLADIEAAAKRIAPYAHVTPVGVHGRSRINPFGMAAGGLTAGVW